MTKLFNRFFPWFLIVLTICVYYQVANFDYIYFDDESYVYKNPHVLSGINAESIKWAFTKYHSNNWHPVTWLSHMADIELFGQDPGKHHLVNIFFHLLNAVLLFYTFKIMTGNPFQSGFVAAVFALHPLHIESVAWIAERKDLLSTLFWLLATFSYIKYVKNRGWITYLLALFFFALGLMSKPMVVTLPFVFILLDYWPLNRLKVNKELPFSFKKHFQEIRCLFIEKIPFFFLSIVSSIITIYVQKNAGATEAITGLSFPLRINNAFDSYIAYILKTIYPHKLSLLYPYPQSIPLLSIILNPFFLLLITGLIFLTMKKKPYLFTGWLWYLGTLLPVIGLFQVGYQKMADRYTYIPMIGLLSIFAWGFDDLFKIQRKIKTKLMGSCAFILLIILSAVSWNHLKTWQNSVMAFQNAIDSTSNNYVAHNNLGYSFERIGKIKEANFHFQKSIEIFPDFLYSRMNLAKLLMREKLYSQSEYHFKEAMKLSSKEAEIYTNLGYVLTQLEKKDEAIEIYEIALKKNIIDKGIYHNLANLYNEKGMIDEAIRHYLYAINSDTTDATAYFSLGNLFIQIRLYSNALRYYNKASSLDPTLPNIYYNIGTAHYHLGNIEDAIKSFQLSLKNNQSNGQADKQSILKKLFGVKSNIGSQIVAVEHKIKQDSDNDELYYQLGYLQYKLNKLDLASKYLNTALAINPIHQKALSILAVVYSKTDSAKAIDVMNTLLRLSPDNAVFNFNIACLYAKDENITKSIVFLEKAIDLGYNNWIRIKYDYDLQSIRNTKEYKNIIKKQKTLVDD